MSKRVKLLKTLEFPDTIIDIKSNGNSAPTPLVSVIIEENPVVQVLDINGEKKYSLEASTTPFFQEWLREDVLVTIHAGEVRVWSLRGSKHDCNRIKKDASNVVGILPIRGKRRDARFIAVCRDGNHLLYKEKQLVPLEPNTIEVTCRPLATSTSPRFFSIICFDEGKLRVDVLSMDLEKVESHEIQHHHVEKGEKIRVIERNGSTAGYMHLNSEGILLGCSFSEAGKQRKLGSDTPVSAFTYDQPTGTVVMGFKDGMINTCRLQKNLGFSDMESEIQGHDFRISCMDLPTRTSLITGGIGGIIKLWNLEPGFFPKEVVPQTTSATSNYKEMEQIKRKISMLHNFIQKAEIPKANTTLKELKTMKLNQEFAQKVSELENELEELTSRNHSKREMKGKLVSFLDKIAETRGDILVS
ncbi:MAG: hypothetical protein ACTSUE_10885, partial [Promethearchaeota archaeon]